MKSILPIILAIGILAPAGCGSDVDEAHDPTHDHVHESAGSFGDQEAPSSRSTSRPAKVQGLPQLTGDKKRDTEAVVSALKRTKAEWTEASNAWHSAIKDEKRKPDPALVSRLEAKTKMLSARAKRLQGMLDEIRNPKQGRAVDVTSGLKLTGDRKKDARIVADALRRTRDEWKSVNAEYMALIAREKQPPQSKVEDLQKKSAALKVQAAGLQKKLDEIRRGS